MCSLTHVPSSGTGLLLYLHYLIDKSLPFTLLLSPLLCVSDATSYAVVQAEIRASLHMPSLCSPHTSRSPARSVGSTSETHLRPTRFPPSSLVLTSWRGHLSSGLLSQPFPSGFLVFIPSLFRLTREQEFASQNLKLSQATPLPFTLSDLSFLSSVRS